MSANASAIVTWAKKYPILLVCIFLCLIMGAFIFMRSGAVGQLQADLDTVTGEVKRYSGNISNSAQLNEQTDFLRKANEAVKARTLSSESLAINLQYFYRLESETGVKYIDLRPGGNAPRAGAKQPATEYVPLSYLVTIQGTYDQVLTYLRHIEAGGYFARVNTASASGSGSTLTVNLNLDLLGSK